MARDKEEADRLAREKEETDRLARRKEGADRLAIAREKEEVDRLYDFECVRLYDFECVRAIYLYDFECVRAIYVLPFFDSVSSSSSFSWNSLLVFSSRFAFRFVPPSLCTKNARACGLDLRVCFLTRGVLILAREQLVARHLGIFKNKKVFPKLESARKVFPKL